jgi:GT2 family glycosyltransferase
LIEQNNKLNKPCQENDQAKPSALQSRASAYAQDGSVVGQMTDNNAALQQQAETISQLQHQLDEARREIRLLEGESKEIAAEMERMRESVGWKLVKKYHRIKNALLPMGTSRRRLYDWLLTGLKTPPSDPPDRSPCTIQELGQARPVPSDDFYRASLRVISPPDVLAAGEMRALRVEVTNRSPAKWRATGRESDGQGSVRFSYHWYDDSGNIVQWEGERTHLPRDLEPQLSLSAEMQIFAPFAAGTFELEITLVHDGVAWFDQKGTTPVRLSVRVEPFAIHVPKAQSCSIVIPAFNGAALTKSCLLGIERSIRADRIQYEVIVVDNGSADGTSHLLESWASSRANARVVSLGRNLGFARACNEGAGLARGRYVVFLNNDMLPTPGWLENMIRLAEDKPRVGIVGSKLLYPDRRIQHLGIVFGRDKNPIHIYRGFSSDIPPAKISREYQAVTGACLMVRKDLFEKVAGMDESYENTCEDVDLCLKIRELGYSVWLCADSAVYHFESMTTGGRLPRHFRNTARLKIRWEDKIESDMDRWYAFDHIKREMTDFEPHKRYDPKRDRSLTVLWRRVYSCEIPELQ